MELSVVTPNPVGDDLASLGAPTFNPAPCSGIGEHSKKALAQPIEQPNRLERNAVGFHGEIAIVLMNSYAAEMHNPRPL